VDDYGNELAIGDQKDIGEFNLIFLSRIEDGL
jgi:ubiquitin carboxyl-terminal hydrolase 25/28